MFNIKNKGIIALILLVLVCSIIGYALYKKNYIKENKTEYTLYDIENTDDIKSYTLEDIKKINNGIDVDVSYGNNGLLKSIYGKFTDAAINNENDAVKSLYYVRDLFGFKDPKKEFTLKKMDKNQNQVIYRFQQIYEGYMVYSNEVIIVTDTEGEAVSVTANYTAIKNIDFSNVIDKKEAVKIASSNCRKGSKYELEKIVYAYKNQDLAVPSWMVRCTNKAYVTEDKTLFLNAESGDIILEVPLTYTNR